MYLNLIQIAESFGVSESVIEGWVARESMPHIPDRGRLLFDRAQVVEWAAERGLTTRGGFLTPSTSVFATGCQIEPLLRIGGIWRDVPSAETLNVLEKVIATLPGATLPIRQLLAKRLRAGNGVTWTPVGGGFALPHLSVRAALGRDSGTVALLLLRDALADAGPTPDHSPVTHLFFFIAPSPRAHLDLLGRLVRTVAQEALRDAVQEDASDGQVFAAVAAMDRTISESQKLAEGKP
ncbi:MAG: PTS sugar transporter subunit IIA [Limisphaerales bacterium]